MIVTLSVRETSSLAPTCDADDYAWRVDCAEALAPLFESCAEAAALEGKGTGLPSIRHRNFDSLLDLLDKTKDAKCVADAYSYLKARKVRNVARYLANILLTA